MKFQIITSVTIYALLLCSAASFAAPNSEPKTEAQVRTTTQKAQPQTKNTKPKTAGAEAPSEQPQIENVSIIAKRYAPIFKKATAALNIDKPLTKDEERRLWADYEAGKYSKNKKFMMYMKQAEPDHKKLRAFVSQFEDLDAVFRVRREERDRRRFRRP